MLLENNKLRADYAPLNITHYFPITAQPQVFIPPLNRVYKYFQYLQENTECGGNSLPPKPKKPCT